MFFLFLSYIGGFLTILSPCILPVLPFVFAKANQSFYKSGLPLLAGMAFTFTGVSLLAVVGGNWVAQANIVGRWVALVLLTLFALSLIFPIYLETLLAPLTRLGVKLNSSNKEEANPRQSFLIGIATGFLWAPCAGPILGLILTGAASQGSTTAAASFLFAYALGAGSSLALALFAGKKVFGRMKKYLKAEAWVKRIIGGAVLLGVIAIAFNLDRTVLTQISKFQTETFEQNLIHLFKGQAMPVAAQAGADEGPMPDLKGAVSWLNSPALTKQELKGKVVLVDFWTYSCINCLRTLPYVKAWAEKYKDQGLVVIGVHTPEFAFEKDISNVASAVKDLGITYPVAIDNSYTIWNAFQNQYWPAHYFVDRNGSIRHHHFGEGSYEESEKVLQDLLGENAKTEKLVEINASGVQATGDMSEVASPETYLGYNRAQNFSVTPGLKIDTETTYTVAKKLNLNDWGLTGNWIVGPEDATLMKAAGKITFKFHARDLHLVLGPQQAGKIVRFKVTIDGKAPEGDHGMDTDAKGLGQVQEHRLYQLIRQQNTGEIKDRTFEIEFLDPGVQAFAFTFG
jgi:cytochrome c biogenesis protein CcdA/thiol-disulfide isomerase/thioredoxin